jgi:hypothetical protein
MKMRIQNIIIVMILFLTMGTPSQAATISGSSERHYKGECGDLIKITYTSDNPSTLLTTAVIDVSTASLGTVIFKDLSSDCLTSIPPVGFTGYSISTDGKQLILNFNNFNPGETMQTYAQIRDAVTNTPVRGSEFAGSRVSVTFTDSGCTLPGTYIPTGDSRAGDNLVNFGGTCGEAIGLSYYRGLGNDPNVVETTDLLKAADDWSNNIAPQGFASPITAQQLLGLADEWARS